MKSVVAMAGLVVCVMCAVVVRAAEPTAVWLDVDVATGEHERDVDDGLAMIQAFHSPELHVIGLSTVYGNTSHERAYSIAQEMVAEFGPPGLTVHPGASSSDELGTETAASDALAAALRERPLTVLALGPLTNIGTLLQHHPELAGRIDSLIIVAGRRPGQRFAAYPGAENAFPDFNFENDPEAMRIILESGVRIVMAPWEVSSHVWITQEDLDWLSEQSVVGRWIAVNSQSWIARWKRDPEVKGFNPFDTLAVGWVTHPELMKSMFVRARIEEGPDDLRPDDAPTQTKPYLLVEPVEAGDEPAIRYCYEPLPEFKNILLERLAVPAD